MFSMAKSYPVEYKGTAFGDPAKFNWDIKKRTDNSNRDIAVADQAKVAKLLNSQKIAGNETLAAAKGNPVSYKGTAIGDPAKFAGGTLKQTGNANTISGAIDPSKLSAVARSNGDQMMTATLAYKGTAFGDPAEKLAARGYPLEYKGTAFGDPAKFGGCELNPDQNQNITRNNVATGNLALANHAPGSILNLLA
jgi:hypothetical protein